MDRTIVQILARRVADTSRSADLRRQYLTRAKLGRLTRPDAATADNERKSAYSSLLKFYGVLPDLNRAFDGIPFELIGDAAAICYGTTRSIECLEVLLPSKQDHVEVESICKKVGLSRYLVDYSEYGDRTMFESTVWLFRALDCSMNLVLTSPVSVEAIEQCESDIMDFREVIGISGLSRCSPSMLFLMKAMRRKPIDVADMVEIIQGGLSINWKQTRQMGVIMDCDDETLECLDDLLMIETIINNNGIPYR